VPAPPSLTTRLLTPRLELRALKTRDVPALYQALKSNAEHLRSFSPAPAAADRRVTLTSVAREVAGWRSRWRGGDTYALFAWPREETPRKIIGRITLGRITRGAFQNAYLGYWVDRERAGQGIATEAVHAALEFAFGTLALHRVQAGVMPHNQRSIRVLEKSGFRKEGFAERYLQIAGRWEDHLIFAITAEEMGFPRRTESAV
jgi:ribosomal-protein-alanine N-acetyltransferase